MDSLTARIPVLKQDSEIITKDFLQLLKENGSQKPADGSVVKRMSLSQYARINSLEKITTVLKRSTGVLESVVNNSENVEQVEVLAEEVEETGVRLHKFCMDHISRDKQVTINDVSMKICENGESSSSYPTNKGDQQQMLFSNKEYIDSAETKTTGDGNALISIDEEEEQVTIKKKRALFNFKKLNIIKTKYFSKKNQKEGKMVKSYESTSRVTHSVTPKIEAIEENTWISDHSTVEKYIQLLFTHVEQLLKVMKNFTKAIERKRALVTLPQRALSTDTAGTFMKLIDMMDTEHTFSWQKANSSQSNFKRSLSFRGRNAVAVTGESSCEVSSTFIDSLSIQMPLRYKRSTGEMSM